MSEKVSLRDEFGQVTRFTGVELANDHTDAPTKPQWVEVTVWRTDGGAYVVQRTTRYRVRHLSDRCSKLGENLLPRPAVERDDVPCNRCNPVGSLVGGYGVESRVSVFVATTPARLVEILADHNTGVHSAFSRGMLADISEIDPDVSAVWMERTIA